jgi:hypothetical protein
MSLYVRKDQLFTATPGENYTNVCGLNGSGMVIFNININESLVGFIKEKQRSEDLTVVNIYVVVFWTTKPCSPPNGHSYTRER